MPPLRLYLFVGYPGSGKTTIARLIEARTGAVHLWVDQIRSHMFGKPTHTREENAQLYDILNKQTDELLAAGKSVIFDTNFNFREDRDNLRTIADDRQAALVLLWIKTPKQLAQTRATHEHHRLRNGYHEIMSIETFEDLTQRLEPPTPDEAVIEIDGRHIDETTVLQQLGISDTKKASEDL